MNPPPTLTTWQAHQLPSQPPEHTWLIDRLWMDGAIGVLGGQPKLGKSWLGLDMAISLASATPCLGRFSVPHGATALVYLAEDALPMVRQRIEALCQHRGLDIQQLALYVVDTPFLQLELPEHAQALWEVVEAIHPKLLVLDPLVRLHRRDENSSHDMSALLNYFRQMQRALHTAIVLVHHSSKKRRAHPGQALRGSGDLHAFSDCALYLTRNESHLQLTVEHRAAPAPPPVRLHLLSRPDGSATHLEIANTLSACDDKLSLTARILNELQHSAQPMRRGNLREALRVNNQRLGNALTELHQLGQIHRTEVGWCLAASRVPITRSLHDNPGDLFKP